MQILYQVSNIAGSFWSVGMAPTPNSKTFTLAADMTSGEIADSSNWLRLQVWADFGAGPKFMASGADWNGGPGKSAPSLAWNFNPANPPKLVYGVLENGIRGNGSPAVAGLSGTFA